MTEYITEDRVCYWIDKPILETAPFNDCDLYIHSGFYIYIYRYIVLSMQKKKKLSSAKFHCLLNWSNIQSNNINSGAMFVILSLARFLFRS